MKTIGLIGFGYWGPNLARVISSLENVNLKWICDLDQEILRIAKKDYPFVQTTHNYKELLKDKTVDAVVIASPASTHEQLVEQAIINHKHVLVEKPLTTSRVSALKLIRLAHKNNVHLATGNVYLYHPAIRCIKSLLKKENLGTVFFLMAQRTNLGPIRADVNVLWDLAYHDVSTVLFLTEAKVSAVYATGCSFLNKEVEDIVNLTLTLDTGVYVTILVSWLAPVKVRQLTIVGNKRMVVFDDTDASQRIKVIDKVLYRFGRGKTIPYRDFKKISFHNAKTRIVDVSKKEPLKEEIIEFINVLENFKSKHSVSSNHSLDVIRVLEAASESLKKQRKITLKHY